LPRLVVILAVAARTVVFRVQVTSTNPTEPKVIVDYGDGTPIDLPTFIDTNTLIADLTHTYEKSGIYNVKITVFNAVSKQERTIVVNLESDFNDFSCVPYWRPNPDDSTQEFAYNLDVNGFYQVRFENDIRFGCTWTRKGELFLLFF
jgi:PKD repeat protein